MLVVHRHLARATTRFLIRRNSSSIPPLSSVEKWKESFRKNNREIAKRPFLCDQLVADKVVKAFLPAPKEDANPQDGKIVIEAYPGAGALTRSLLALPPSRLKKLIVLEDNPVLFNDLKVLEQHDPRITVIPRSGFLWLSYTELEAQGLLKDVNPVAWKSEAQPNLHFISHLPNTVHGDQLLNQIFRCMPMESWLFKYGRVPLSFLMTESIWERTSADIKSGTRCKLSVIAEAVSDCTKVVPSSDMHYNEHFYPPTGVDDEVPAKKKRKSAGRQSGVPYVAVNVEPRAKSFIKPGLLDKWDFILRKLFVLKASPLQKGIPSIAPGAASLMSILKNHIPGGNCLDTEKQIRRLTVEDWALIVEAFDAWPFAPEDLLVTDTFYRDIERKT
ncbi:S-adenosyl-L-methionine-dependent methyltransferase [Schizopora paradoxa]|uniref:rRNA adenine N(6)-methyltransferase n=1 Tax=Schizopora paradoxa TaxID=27342 RepID=A0A0H2S1Z0_9AGAM|nr:S-adenosyl-L-methionine-dependent methyltransferase [Schizopora paradoxa]